MERYYTLLQEGLSALKSLLMRRKGVQTWNTDDVVSWLRDVGLWSEDSEREVKILPKIRNVTNPDPLTAIQVVRRTLTNVVRFLLFRFEFNDSVHQDRFLLGTEPWQYILRAPFVSPEPQDINPNNKWMLTWG